MGLAVLNYASAHAGELPPGGITNGPCCGTRSNESWSISILPQLEQQNLYDLYDFTEVNERQVNWPVLQTIVPVYLCPSDEDTQILERPESGPGSNIPMARGSYRANTGRCVEVGGPGGSNPCKRAWGSLHPGGLHFSFGDGSVHFLDIAIDMQVFAEMATMAGGEVFEY